MKNSYHIITIGCQMNKADSERLAAFLENNNFKVNNDLEKAGLVVINTCGIRQTAEDRLYGLAHQVKKRNSKAKLVVTGCLSKRSDVHRRLAKLVDVFMPINEMPNILDLLAKREVKTKLSLEDVRQMQGEKYLSIIPKYENKFSAYVPIGNGCNNFCSYCVVPYARGREVYRPAKEIISEVKNLIKNGYKEVILIAQNVNSYHDKDLKFTDLLQKVEAIPGDYWLRFSSSHPKDVSSELIDILASSSKICSHLHLALQSGDDEILKAMNRKYTANDFIKIVEKLRKLKPEIAITTDAIVGFPGENKKQFASTDKLFKKIGFDLAYVSRYSSRPGTVSSNMVDNVTAEEKARREMVLETTFKKSALINNTKYIGRVERVLIEGVNKKNKYYGKTSSYKMVLINSGKKVNKNLIGNFCDVEFVKADALRLEGVLINGVNNTRID